MTSSKLSRRDMFTAAAGLSAAAMAAHAGAQSEASKPQKPVLSVPQNGYDYAKVPLKKGTVTVSAVQTRVVAVDGKNPRPGIKDNLKHMLKAIDKAVYYSGPKDLLCFHEFPITGWDKWSRKEIERLSIEIPGPETEAIAKKAKEHGCYIKFGSYVRDPDWPGHILSITSIIDPKSNIIAKDWKARNIKGVFPGFELITTTVYNVLDQYIEMYGEDAVIPVHRTDIGNLTTSSVQREPELFRVMAMKGAEILLRTASGGFSIDDIKMMSTYNSVFSIIVNNAVSPTNPNFFEDSGGGGSTIFGPRGEVLAEARNAFEQDVTARIDMKAFRARHKLPDVHKALYQPIYDQYQPRYAPGLFKDFQPPSLEDAKPYLDKHNRWTK